MSPADKPSPEFDLDPKGSGAAPRDAGTFRTISADLNKVGIGTSLRGCVDQYGKSLLTGWVVDMDDPDRPILVKLVMADLGLSEIGTGTFRRDISEIIDRDVRAGFALPLTTRDAAMAQVAIERATQAGDDQVVLCKLFDVVVAGTGWRLPWSVRAQELKVPISDLRQALGCGQGVAAKPATVPSSPDLGRAAPQTADPEPQAGKAEALSGFAPDARPADPASHYLATGWREGRDPAAWFSGWHYLALHKDVAAVGINPFVHYNLSGKREGRELVPLGRISAPLDGKADLFKEVFSVAAGAQSPFYAPLTERQACVRPDHPRAIAFYLPQFHPFEQNDLWWGKGFTEWTNVSKAVPQFSGQYQPRLPGELGHYDLRLPEVMARQIELARQFGLHGFCFHYYWFGGQRLLEKPLDMFLSRKDAAFDFPFCLCWANENWTRRWDGAEQDVLMQQSHTVEDHAAVIDDLMRYLKDPRYIKVGNRPVIVIYRPTTIDDLAAMVQIWRRRAKEEGFDDLLLVATNAFGLTDCSEIGFDALVEFPPHNIPVAETSAQMAMFNQRFQGKVYKYEEASAFSLQRLQKIADDAGSANYIPGVMMNWDNEARRPGRGHVFHGCDPRRFHDWFAGALEFSRRCHAPEARMVFVNAWNEWGEGTYLEPDRWFGYAYLNAVAAAYDTLNLGPAVVLRAAGAQPAIASRKTGVVLLHAYYHDLLPELAARLQQPWMRDQFDIVATVPPHWTYRQMQDALEVLKADRVLVTPNVGRDIFPFMQALQDIAAGDYQIALKIHTKKSPHLPNGARWRQAILDSLMGEAEVATVRAAFADQADLGLFAPRSLYMPFNDPPSLSNNQSHIDAIIRRYDLGMEADAGFVAGSMFWFRPVALQRLLHEPLGMTEFGPELGAIDGTLAHAMERLLPGFVLQAGFRAQTYESAAEFNPYL